MIDHWEIFDLYKALLAVAAGLILGLERELKDKAAGLKTITIITLGATLFSIISYKVGGADKGTAIAAYIVSGVGFIGAGVIFKDGSYVYKTINGGNTWTKEVVLPNKLIIEVHFRDAQHGWACGTDGVILKFVQ